MAMVPPRHHYRVLYLYFRPESMADMDEERAYRRRMAFTVLGVSLSIPLLFAVLLLVMDFFFNPFREW
jgi:hypothetical protein